MQVCQCRGMALRSCYDTLKSPSKKNQAQEQAGELLHSWRFTNKFLGPRKDNVKKNKGKNMSL